MFWFQLLLVVAVIAVTVLMLRSLRGEKSLALKRLLALLFVVAAVVMIAFPSLLTKIANFFGVGRGVDFLLYMFIIAGMLFAVAVIRAKARSDARVTRLARAVALMEARMLEHRTDDTHHLTVPQHSAEPYEPMTKTGSLPVIDGKDSPRA